MKRILLTGMSGCGKSTLLAALSSEHNICVDLDQSGWIARDPETGERAIRTDALLKWMNLQRCRNLILAGCESNQGKLYPFLDAVIVLTAPPDVMHRRILARENPFGKRKEEWRKILSDKEQFEPLLMRNCSCICNTDRPLKDVLHDIRCCLENE